MPSVDEDDATPSVDAEVIVEPADLGQVPVHHVLYLFYVRGGRLVILVHDRSPVGLWLGRLRVGPFSRGRAVLEQADQPPLGVTVALDVALSCLDRTVANEFLHVA